MLLLLLVVVVVMVVVVMKMMKSVDIHDLILGLNKTRHSENGIEYHNLRSCNNRFCCWDGGCCAIGGNLSFRHERHL